MMWIYDCAAHTEGSTAKPPFNIAGTAISFDTCSHIILAHGGKDRDSVHGQLALYDCTKKSWSVFDASRQCSKPFQGSNFGLTATLNASSPRRSDHAACCFDGKFVIHGGKNESNATCNDVFVFHIRMMQWERLSDVVGGCAPPFMHGHAACHIDDERLCFIGLQRLKRPRGSNGPTEALAVFFLSLGFTPHWRELPSGNNPPPRRRGFRIESMKDGHSIVLIGGQFSQQEQRDIWMLNCCNGIWMEIDAGISPMDSSLEFHRAFPVSIDPKGTEHSATAMLLVTHREVWLLRPLEKRIQPAPCVGDLTHRLYFVTSVPSSLSPIAELRRTIARSIGFTCPTIEASPESLVLLAVTINGLIVRYVTMPKLLQEAAGTLPTPGAAVEAQTSPCIEECYDTPDPDDLTTDLFDPT